MAYYCLTECIIFVLVSILLIRIIQFYLGRRRLYKLAELIPGPKGYPLIGNALDFFEVSTEKIFHKTQRYFDTNPEVFKLWIGPKLVIGVGKPEDLEVILNHKECLTKDHLYDILELVLGNGLFTATVNTWKRHRKILNPLFKQKILETFVPGLIEHSNILLTTLEKNVGNQDLDIYKKLNNLSTSFTCEAVMGVEVNSQTASDHYGHWVDQAFPIILLRMSNVFYRNDFLFKWTKYKKVLDEMLFKIHNFTSVVVKKRKALFRQNNFEQGNIPTKSLLDLLIQQSNETEFTEEEMKAEMNTIIIGGIESTSTTMGFCLLLLAMHPDIQQRVYEEVMDVIGEDRDVTSDDLHRLAYTEKCIKETMRLFPVGPLIMRNPTADIELRDFTIPKGSSILLNAVHTHRSPRYWKDPLKFDPERFSSEEIAKRHPYSYVPFSAGPRGCIGFKLAIITLKTLLPTIVRKFKVKTKYSSIEEVDLSVVLSLRPAHGFKVWVEARN